MDRAALLQALVDGHSLAEACARVGISRVTLWRVRHAEPAFDQQIALAVAEGKRLQVTAGWQVDYLQALRSGQTNQQACVLVGASRSRVWRTRQADPSFAHAHDVARRAGRLLRAASHVRQLKACVLAEAMRAPALTLWQQRFLEALRAGASVRAATQAAGRSRAGVYAARRRNAAFAQAWDEAYHAGG